MERILVILILNLIVLITGAFEDEMSSIGSIAFEKNPKRTLALKKKRETDQASWLETLATAESCGRPSEITSLIIGGEAVNQGEYPWMVALFHYENNSLVYKCGATLISNTYVITAAHCTMNQARVHLDFGKNNINDRFENHYLSRTSMNIMRHPEYDNTSYGDVALISFDPITFTRWIKPICLWGNFDTKLRWGTVAGWGQENNDGTRSKTPLQVNVSMVVLEKCRNSHADLQIAATNKTFCAGGKSSGPCHGDSGGGFYVIRDNIWYLRGVISHSLGTFRTCNVDEYSIYVDLTYFLDWIAQLNKASRLEPMTSVGSCGRSLQATPQIIEVNAVTQGEYPWMVALFHYRNSILEYKCGATLISDTYVITAAHCTFYQQRVLLKFGKHNIENEEHSLSRTSKKIIRYPEYEDPAHGDVALISFKRITFSQKVKPICLWDNFGTKLRWGIVAGWGREFKDGDVSPTPLQLNLLMVGLEECRNSDERLRTVATNKTFCAGGRGIGPCHGHAGSGFYVLHNNIWYLRGIVSTSIGNTYECDFNKYSVYVDLAYFLDWMRPYLMPK